VISHSGIKVYVYFVACRLKMHVFACDSLLLNKAHASPDIDTDDNNGCNNSNTIA
jgi:hypothetical protein